MKYRRGRRAEPEIIRTGRVIYCDGAAEPNPGNGGWGYVVYHDEAEIFAEHGGQPDATNNQMELTGMIRALEYVKRHRQFTVIYCDSAYVVDGTNQWRLGWKRKGWRRGGANSQPENQAIANLDLWKQIDALIDGDGLPVKIVWVRGHVGTRGNERADELSIMGMNAVVEARRNRRMIEEQMRMRT